MKTAITKKSRKFYHNLWDSYNSIPPTPIVYNRPLIHGKYLEIAPLAGIIFLMNIFWACLLLVGGLLVLYKSADFLVAGSVSLAQSLGVSSLVIGLTVVAMGTSAPEVAASIAAGPTLST